MARRSPKKQAETPVVQLAESPTALRVFLSWSGERSRAVAMSLKELIEGFFDDVQGWVSAHDIQAGKRWTNALEEALAETYFGVLCLTPENLDSRWVLFEAGALSKKLGPTSVIPYLLGLVPTDVAPPLSQFQNVAADREGTFRLMSAINAERGSPLADDRFRSRFDAYWPGLERQLENIPPTPTPGVRPRETHELLAEVLELVRLIPNIQKAVEAGTPGKAVAFGAPPVAQAEAVPASFLADVKSMIGSIPEVRTSHEHGDAQYSLAARELIRQGFNTRESLESLVSRRDIIMALASIFREQFGRDLEKPLDPQSFAELGPFLFLKGLSPPLLSRISDKVGHAPDYQRRTKGAKA